MEIKSDFYVALKVQLEIFSSFFFPFFKSLLTFFLRAKRVCTVRVFFFFFLFTLGCYTSLFGKLHDADENVSERKIVSRC